MIYKDMPASWRRTFLTLWLGCFITGLGFSMTMPFMALYIESFGHYSRTQINFYSGLAFSVTYFAQAVVSPYWGNLADRKGRKLMCLRASGVMTFTVFLTGLATNVYMIIFLRLLQWGNDKKNAIFASALVGKEPSCLADSERGLLVQWIE